MTLKDQIELNLSLTINSVDNLNDCGGLSHVKLLNVIIYMVKYVNNLENNIHFLVVKACPLKIVLFVDTKG